MQAHKHALHDWARPGAHRHALGGAPAQRRARVCTRADRSGGGRGDKGKDKASGLNPDKADAKKADFSAFWSMKFRNFFSKRRQYLEDAAKPQGPPPAVLRLEEKIAAVKAQLAQQAELDAEEAARLRAALFEYEQQQREEDRALQEQLAPQAKQLQQKVDAALAPLDRVLPGWDSQGPLEIVLDDVDMARRHLHRRRTKVFTLGVAQFRALLAAVVMAPFTLPAALHQRWQALFAGRRYENFLMSEGERVWGWRNRTENERWFWEVFFLDRFLVPLLFHLCYQIVVPDNLLWAVLVPVSFIIWVDGKPPTPANMEFWLIAVLGLYGKCWHQVTAAARFVFQWA